MCLFHLPQSGTRIAVSFFESHVERVNVGKGRDQGGARGQQELRMGSFSDA